MIGALLRLRRSELIDRPLLGRTKGKFRKGLAYVRHQPDVRRPLLVMVVVGTMALNFQTTSHPSFDSSSISVPDRSALP